MSARTASIAFLALIFPVAALVFPKNAWAASGNVQVCHPNSSCTIGEFLYDDSYDPITNATCTITVREPDGDLLTGTPATMDPAAQNDGWYSYEFTAPATLGLYRTEVKCTTAGGETLALDKSFEIQNLIPSASDVASATWGYSTRSLSTFGTLTADIWGYSTRSLTGFGTLVADIWSSTTRTLTGAGLSSGSLATKSDVDNVNTASATSTTNITNIQNITNETRDLLEEMIHKPIIETVLENGTVEDILSPQSKLDESTQVASKMLTNGNYLKSKTSLISEKWGGLSQERIQKSLNDLVGVNSSLDEQISRVKNEWSLPITSQLELQNNKVLSSLNSASNEMLKNGKTKTVSAKLASLTKDIDKLIKLIGNDTDNSKNTLFGQLKDQTDLLSRLDKGYFELNSFLASMQTGSKTKPDMVKEVNALNKQVALVNQLPKIEKTLLSEVKVSLDDKQLKNKVLALRGVVEANRLFIASGSDKPLSSLWLEEGSIVFKILLTNPSKRISQTIPVKYYLPQEVAREDVVSLDEGLTVSYDHEKNQYFVSGEFTLPPDGSQTLSVTIDDKVFHVAQEEIASFRKQAEELFKPLENTAYFAQGSILKSDISASLDRIEALQKNGVTPEAKIRAYRDAQVEYKAAKDKLEKLKEIATQAGSIGTLFGFVGGAQALAVWGLIIVMAAGFVFLTLYLRQIKRSEDVVVSQTVAKPKTHLPDAKRHSEGVAGVARSSRSYGMVSLLIIGAIGVIFAGIIGLSVRNSVQRAATYKPQELVVNDDQKGVLGKEAEKLEDPQGEKGYLFVPEESVVTLHSGPKLDSTVLATLVVSQTVLKMEREDGWVKIAVESNEDQKTTGWVDEDFVEDPKQNTPSFQLVTVSDTPTGFLRVRSGPGGKELGKVEPGSKYPILDSKNGWLQIVLDDGSLGWVSNQYIAKSIGK